MSAGRSIVVLLAAATLAACAAAPQRTPSPNPAAAPASAAAPHETIGVGYVIPDEVRARILAPDRSPEDQTLDAGRKPEELVSFAGIEPGMKVADLIAGTGYTTEVLARAVGEGGTVYGQNNKLILGFAKDAWPARLAKPVMAKVIRVDRELADPLPPEAKGLDAVVMVLFYHDLFWTGDDRAALNRAVFAALSPGGVYVILDHSGRPGTWSTEVKTLHRIEQRVVEEEVARAGFVLRETGHMYENPADTRDWDASPMAAGAKRGTSDRFILKFEKPAAR